MYISIHICTKVGSDRFKVGICSGRFGSLQGRIKSPKVGSRSGRSDPPTSPSLFVPGPRADVYAEGRPQRGASEAHVGYRIRNNSSSSNSNSSNIIFMLIMIIEMPIIYRADASPGWGSNFPRALPQGGEATSPGYFPRVGKQLPQGTSPGSFPRPGEPNPQVGWSHFHKEPMLILNQVLSELPQGTPPGRGNPIPRSGETNPQVVEATSPW